MKTGLAPIYDSHTKILILGSAPSEISLARQQYYANPGNQFWKIVFSILEPSIPEEYGARIALLKQHNVGLWDVYRKFDRDGSMDTNFSAVIPNDFSAVLSEAPIELIIANGKKAYHEALKISQFDELTILPALSTSGANNGRAKERMISWYEALQSKNNLT